MAYNLRSQATKNYKDTSTPRLPRAERIQHDPDRLYAAPAELTATDTCTISHHGTPRVCVTVYGIIRNNTEDQLSSTESVN